ncbi:MAG: ComF family protein [Aquisalimonadaceae bacterium]
MVYESIEWVLQQVFPPTCCACGDPGLGRYDICAGCYRDLPRLVHGCRLCAEPLFGPELICGRCQKHPPAFDRVIAPYIYAPPIDSLIHAFKYAAQLSGGRLLGALLARHLRQRGTTADLLLPIPLHPARLRRRGFNQAMELTRCLGPTLDIPTDHRRLRRTRSTGTQSALSREARRRNMRNAFAFRGRLDGLTVALVDDVLTTGSTADAAARTLRRAGAARIEIWAVARASQLLP